MDEYYCLNLKEEEHEERRHTALDRNNAIKNEQMAVMQFHMCNCHQTQKKETFVGSCSSVVLRLGVLVTSDQNLFLDQFCGCENTSDLPAVNKLDSLPSATALLIVMLGPLVLFGSYPLYLLDLNDTTCAFTLHQLNSSILTFVIGWIEQTSL